MNELSLFPAQPPAGEDIAPPAVGLGATPAGPTSLYRKYRPQSFDEQDLVGQEHVVRTIRNAIKLGRVAHAYLFCGPRGTGKTTTARLLAKAVNCLDPDPDHRPCNACAACVAIAAGTTPDVIEIDAASNRGIDDVRDLRERVKYAPSQLRSKFYIVDEAHQITGAAANAFLKTLEEPPAHARFVLATTDPEELLPTIVSRCQRFDFRRIGFEAMAGRLRTVADLEAIAITDEALAEIARHATGSLRDALGLLEQLALHAADAGNPIGADAVRALLGISRNDRVERLLHALAEGDPAAALATVNAAAEAGEDPRQLNRQLVAALRDRLHRAARGDDNGPLDLPRLADLLRRFGEIDFRMRHSPYPLLPLEIALVESTAGVATTAPAARPEAAARPAEPSAPATPPGRRLLDRVREDAGYPGSSAATSQPSPSPPGSPAAGRRMEPVAPAPPASPAATPSAAGAERVAAAEVPAPVAALAQPPPVNGFAPADGAAPRPVAAEGTLTVDAIADLWPRIRQDVKALNRRAEALLSSCDPARVVGDRILLATPYEFHRDKLNSDEIKTMVAGVIGRRLGRPVSIEAVLTGEVAVVPTPAVHVVDAPAPAPAAATAPEPPASPPPPGDDIHALRLKAAINIFDGEPYED